ncbi:hypothetical protein [Halosimplex pelagicum]|uniref:Uncharacterized protein n=1 Tax=Halosimplex pelagicum TaxID=869886 RepID=A0A7D5TBW8_9EURY|nr:hypothetical protein [Halosimplex pelagicum]QLH82477.1 hypothetical protein HZS54_13005 [Halosimplex pelagicum]QLH82533.1 hypothetical protein HZS54_13310 [Halosimplex pelagicum]
MALEHWRAVKGVFYSLLITALAAYSIHEGRGEHVVLATAATILIVTTLEVKEVEFLNALSITFFRTDQDDDGGER